MGLSPSASASEKIARFSCSSSFAVSDHGRLADAHDQGLVSFGGDLRPDREQGRAEALRRMNLAGGLRPGIGDFGMAVMVETRIVAGQLRKALAPPLARDCRRRTTPWRRRAPR